jgi:ATP adenylyltransferase
VLNKNLVRSPKRLLTHMEGGKMHMATNEDLSYKTAKTRNSPSKPMQLLHERGLLRGRMLDFGCGKGFDAEYFGMDAFDPHYNPRFPLGKYDTITCIYVLNTLHPSKVDELLETLMQHLKEKGNAYIAVRRDVEKERYTSTGTFQRNVKLPLPIIYEDSRTCIYRMKG